LQPKFRYKQRRGDKKSPLLLEYYLNVITEANIRRLVDEKLNGTEIFLVDVIISTGNKIQIEVDRDNGVSVKDCVSISRHVEQNLDREKEDFELQVSSPGLDKPLKILRQYQKNIGRNVELVLISGEKKEGKLLSTSDDGITIEAEEKVKDEKTKKKKTIKKVYKYNFQEIKETKIVISFK
jgi:ribosome maturation factor RimP